MLAAVRLRRSGGARRAGAVLVSTASTAGWAPCAGVPMWLTTNAPAAPATMPTAATNPRAPLLMSMTCSSDPLLSKEHAGAGGPETSRKPAGISGRLGLVAQRSSVLDTSDRPGPWSAQGLQDAWDRLSRPQSQSANL